MSDKEKDIQAAVLHLAELAKKEEDEDQGVNYADLYRQQTGRDLYTDKPVVH